jgi:hypothetical protein
MGLLDGLLGSSGGGGLLDFLRANAMNQQFSSGLPSDQAQYGQPQMQAMAQMQPAAPQPPAQPMQGQQQAPQFGPQEGAFATGLRALGNPGGAINKIADAVQGFTTGQTPVQRQQAQLYQAYVQAGLSPSQAYVAVLNPKLADNMLGGGRTDDIKEFEYAKKENPSLTFEKFMLQKKANQGEYGLQGIWGVKDGKPALIQLGKSGEAIQSKLPQGFEPAQKPIEIDAGTHRILIDPQTRQPIAQIPKNVAAKEAEEKVGQARGTAQAALANGADIDAEETKKKIDQFIESKGFNEVFGQIDQYRPKWSHSDAGADSLARYEQLTGVAFLSAYSMLKGGGAITDIEGQKAGAAMARLNRAQSEAEAKQALIDFKEAVDTGLRKLKRAANGGAEPSEPAAAPKRIRLNADGTIAQ